MELNNMQPLYKECDKCKSVIGVKDACDVCKPLTRQKKYEQTDKGKVARKKCIENQKLVSKPVRIPLVHIQAVKDFLRGRS